MVAACPVATWSKDCVQQLPVLCRCRLCADTASSVSIESWGCGQIFTSSVPMEYEKCKQINTSSVSTEMGL
jgi:hypothetical protein